jgi:2-phosphoglycerate kinase
MIYLIGGPPKCGKTTLAKALAQAKGIPWVSTDTLQSVIKPYIRKGEYAEKFPASFQRCEDNDEKYSKYSVDEIISAYQKQAVTSAAAIEMFTLSELTDGNDFIIEGYHVTPDLASKLKSKFPQKTRSLFLVQGDKQRCVDNIKNSTTPNDWILARTKKEGTYDAIAEMICAYSKIIHTEAEKHGLKIISLDGDFENKIQEIVNGLFSA